MFENSRYLTCGVQATLPDELIFKLWQMIDARNKAGAKLDYLQVFDLGSAHGQQGKVVQKITHSQEVPAYKETYAIEIIGHPIHAKIFVIDDEDHSTMLLAEEY